MSKHVLGRHKRREPFVACNANARDGNCTGVEKTRFAENTVPCSVLEASTFVKEHGTSFRIFIQVLDFL